MNACRAKLSVLGLEDRTVPSAAMPVAAPRPEPVQVGMLLPAVQGSSVADAGGETGDKVTLKDVLVSSATEAGTAAGQGGGGAGKVSMRDFSFSPLAAFQGQTVRLRIAATNNRGAAGEGIRLEDVLVSSATASRAGMGAGKVSMNDILFAAAAPEPPLVPNVQKVRDAAARASSSAHVLYQDIFIPANAGTAIQLEDVLVSSNQGWGRWE